MSAAPPVNSLPSRPPRSGRWGPGFVLALLVHGLLIVALTLGVSWRSSDRSGASAELWAAVPQIAAPREQAPPQPEPKPEPRPEPKPEPKPEPRPEPKPEPKVDTREADLAIEKARQEKLQREEQERREKAQREREQQERREREEELAKKKAAEEARKKKELEEQQAREEKRRLQEQEARVAKMREDNLRRMQGMAGATGEPNSGGTALRSAGPSASYAGRVRARVLPNIVLTRELPGNPTAEVTVRAAPDGTVLDRRIARSSGVPEWDEAVLRAIDRTATMPRDADGTVPSPITIVFRRD